MRCSTFHDGDAFVLCVEDVPASLAPVLEGAYFQRDEDGDRFVKRYSGSVEDQDTVAENFSRLTPAMFSGKEADWQAALIAFANRCADAGIEWYATGSVCDAIRGIDVTPHDLDLVTNTRDFWRAREIFRPEMIEPFVDNGGTWVVRYFGRICLANVQIDLVADSSRNADVHHYEAGEWQGRSILIEPFDIRYRTEIDRNRQDRIAAFHAFLQRTSTGSV